MTSLGIAALMATQGSWPVLPFAGLEMLVLGWALRVSLRNRHVIQRLAISGDEFASIPWEPAARNTSCFFGTGPRLHFARRILRCTPAGY